jgi:alpha-L-fucosidase 2
MAGRPDFFILRKIFPMKNILIVSMLLLCISCKYSEEDKVLRLWYDLPADTWNEALPVGNGRLGAMVFGGVKKERIQFNEETLWTGGPHDYANEGAVDHLEEIRQLLRAGKQQEAEVLAMEEFMSVPLRQKEYQPFGDIYLEFPGHQDYSGYSRELDISNAICRTSYLVDEVRFTREIFSSHPSQVIVIQLDADKAGSLNFQLSMDSPHVQSTVTHSNGMLQLDVAVADGVLRGTAGIHVETDGMLSEADGKIAVQDASSATLRLSAATSFISYADVSGDPVALMKQQLDASLGSSFKSMKEAHMADYRAYFDRFSLDLGNNGRDTIPTDQRLLRFMESPEDPSLISLYTQFGRYLMISASRPGTRPSNLQGIWNQDVKPAWGSKYTVNINTEMNYWPAEISNLSECHEPLFKLVEECSVTGKNTATKHYGAGGWVLHHNTDLWRGTAPINHSNHGIWVGGSGWLSHHFWEHYLFTRDLDFLRERAYPVMKSAAEFYSQYLVKDSSTGWLISTPSNSPEIGGLVAGPTMDHQIIRSLFKACIEAAMLLDRDADFAAKLQEQVKEIAPNQIGQYGQLQEWLEDVDDPTNKHRHVSHLWGMHPGNDFNWETSPDLMDAARQSLIFRGDDGTGWSLAWKINFWARLRDGDHAYELIKLQFRPVLGDNTSYSGGGGSYPNLFDAHPPFQIDGNFGAPAGIIEMLLQSHLSSIDLLPALPSSLPQGRISGVCARGGFELDFSWEDGVLQEVEVLSRAGEPCNLRYGEHQRVFETEKGKRYRLDAHLNML